MPDPDLEIRGGEEGGEEGGEGGRSPKQFFFRPLDLSLVEKQGGARGPFLESPGNFSGPKSNIQIEIIIKNKNAVPG